MFDTKLLAAMTLFCAALLPAATRGDSPPDMPLPPCTYVGGVFYGACPAESNFVSGSASGRFVTGATLLVRTNPGITVCDFFDAQTWLWSPSDCYSRVAAPRVVTCATIDLQDNQRFRELPCTEALYRSTQGLPSQLFTMKRPSPGYGGRTTCGDTPDYRTYGWGGPRTIGASTWAQRGPRALDCEVTFAGTRRPDGLYGPTWVKIEVQLNYAQTGHDDPGRSEWAQFYIPIDGDMRTTPDVEVSGSASVTNADWASGQVLATYRVTLRNRSTTDLENVQLTAGLPSLLMAQSVSNSNCRMPGNFEGIPPAHLRLTRGGNVICEWPSLAAESSITLDIVARILNATDLAALQEGVVLQNFKRELQGVELTATASNDQNSSNNTALVKVDIPFRSGSYDETRLAMEALAPYFDYKTDIYFSACNTYKEDIFKRLENIRAQHPEAVANLSFGDITSGDYDIAGYTAVTGRAGGHVGVVVYVKGTNYRQAGIIINGTPSPSPLTAVSEIGPSDPGGGFGLAGWTGLNGNYLRTPANQFPGMPHQETARGFEGQYGNNGSEFTYGGVQPEPLPPGPAPLTCPIAPDAMTVRTESPVDLIVTNSRGQRIETQDGEIVVQELDTGITSMAFPHHDGTYAWTLVLPVDDYKVQLRGTRAGSYRLTLTTFAQDGTPKDIVSNGTTLPGQMEEYTLNAPDVIAPPPAPTPLPAEPQSSESGGGGIDALMLLAILSLAIMSPIRRQSRRTTAR